MAVSLTAGTMKTPYNCLHTSKHILFAARSSRIHSFSLLDGEHKSTWQHPDGSTTVEAVEEPDLQTRAPPSPSRKEASDGTVDAADERREPPTKRLKLQGDATKDGADPGPTTSLLPAASQDQHVKHANGDHQNRDNGSVDALADKEQTDGKTAKGRGGSRLARIPDRPIITQLTSSEDGRHVLAVSGHDKTIWVFEHDGQGCLTLLNKRTMPKRPSAIVLTPDAQIICADKFGDVYCLPLSTASLPASSATRSSRPALAVKASEPEASTLTVHSKRNLEALQNQKKQLELGKLKDADADSSDIKNEEPDSDLALLLGHVSMLTALVLGESDGRRYMLTADRDEHIRVSRYLPQTHVIHGFCLGHREFVAAMAIPASRPEILVSGGGDDELFVWDWVAGRLLSKKGLLPLVRQVNPQTDKVAVSALRSLLYPCESGSLSFILAICEGIEAIFSWQLSNDGILSHPGVLPLPGNPLDLAVAGPSPQESTPRLAVAMDPRPNASSTSLALFTLKLEAGALALDAQSPLRCDTLEAEEPEATADQVRDLLYTVEKLRKQTVGSDEVGASSDATAAEKVDGIETAADSTVAATKSM